MNPRLDANHSITAVTKSSESSTKASNIARSSSRQKQSNPPESSNSSLQSTLTNIPETVVSDSPEKDEHNLSSSPDWPNHPSPSLPEEKGLLFFTAKKSNVLNLYRAETNTTWRYAFPGSETLCWKEKDESAVNLFVVGHLRKPNLKNAKSRYENDDAYRLELVLDGDTAEALRTIMENGPLNGRPGISYPLLGRAAKFSIKLRTLAQHTDDRKIDVNDPFPYLFDGRDVAKGRQTLLKAYSAEQLSDDDMLAVESVLSSYEFRGTDESPGRIGYSLSLRSIWFLAKNTLGSAKNPAKRQGDNLVSPKKNKRPGYQMVVFSDEE
jgi:hypothetical protein